MIEMNKEAAYARLLERDFDPLSTREREVVGCGQSSVALTDTDHTILLVTTTKSARNIQLLVDHVAKLKEQGVKIPEALILPEPVGTDLDVASLISPDNPSKGKKRLNARTASLKPGLWEHNVVYRLERFDGTIEDFDGVLFKQDSIKQLMEMLTEALDFMHHNGFTHNDIAGRNLFFKGEYPKLIFGLGDFGDCSYNVKHLVKSKVEKKAGKDEDKQAWDLSAHHSKIRDEYARMNSLEDRLKKLLQSKESPQKGVASPSERAKLAGRPRRSAAIKSLNNLNRQAKGNDEVNIEPKRLFFTPKRKLSPEGETKKTSLKRFKFKQF